MLLLCYTQGTRVLPDFVHVIMIILFCPYFFLTLAPLHLQFGNIPNTPFPRVVDMGQCNDSYGAVVVASALAKAFNTDVNGTL